MNPVIVVDILLEQEDRADSDPREHPAFPRGIYATRGAETFQIRFQRTRTGTEYRFTKTWPDDYTGKPRSIEGHYLRASNPEAMTRHLEQKSEEFRANGWTVELHGP